MSDPTPETQPSKDQARKTESIGMSGLAIERLEQLSLEPVAKAELLLVGLGVKPSTLHTFRSATWTQGEAPKPIMDEQFDAYMQVLAASGLKYEVTDDVTVDPTQELLRGSDGELLRASTNVDWAAELAQQHRQSRRTVFVARDDTALDLLKRAADENDARLFGQAYGFPPTAVDAYLHNAAQSPKSTPETDPAVLAFAQFGVSADNWAEELKTAKRWADAVQHASPAIFRDMTARYQQ